MTFPFWGENINTAAKCLGDNLLKFAALKLAEFVIGRKNFEAAAKSVGRQTLRKQFGTGSQKRTASRTIPTKSAKQTSRSRRDLLTNISH